MANNMNVSLDANDCLDIDDNGGQNQVSKSPNPQTISWNLTGKLTQGNFVPISAANPGFEWIQKPPAGVFSLPEVSANGNSLSIQDTHKDSTSDGTWIYLIRVEYQKQIYETTYEVGIGGTANNPVIINKDP